MRLGHPFFLGVPADLFCRLDLDALYLPFVERALELVARCRDRGADYFAISGFRSYQEQVALYAQGRTSPGKVVTNAKPGQSAHNLGLAIDFCRDANVNRSGLQPDWDLASYELLAEEARGLGLESGLTWRTFREGPHVQFHLGRHAVTMSERHLHLPELRPPQAPARGPAQQALWE